MEQALTPDLNEVNEKVRATELPIYEDTSGSDIASLKEHKGWQEIEEYIKGRIVEIREFSPKDLSMEEIGYRHMLSMGIRQELEQILTIIDANDEQRREKQERGTDKA